MRARTRDGGAVASAGQDRRCKPVEDGWTRLESKEMVDQRAARSFGVDLADMVSQIVVAE
jgi:hypothetical protein